MHHCRRVWLTVDAWMSLSVCLSSVKNGVRGRERELKMNQKFFNWVLPSALAQEKTALPVARKAFSSKWMHHFTSRIVSCSGGSPTIPWRQVLMNVTSSLVQHCTFAAPSSFGPPDCFFSMRMSAQWCSVKLTTSNKRGFCSLHRHALQSSRKGKVRL